MSSGSTFFRGGCLAVQQVYARHHDAAYIAIAAAGLAGGIVLHLTGRPEVSSLVWAAATAPVLLALIIQIARSLRRGDVGLDLVAALSMSAALGFGEPLAGNIVALMYAGGQVLENFAQGQARRQMTALLGRVSHTALRLEDNQLQEVPISVIAVGDRLLIRQGEVIPVDGTLAAKSALLDLSALTGEALPVMLKNGDEVLSGATCVGLSFELVATHKASDSTYSGIVRLVEGAQASRAPFVRMAYRYSVGFLILTVSIAAIAWGASGDPLRALSVLVVATPCPLILAVPVAMISGLSRAARSGILIKSGSILEALAGIRTVIFDKTGTLTFGRTKITEIRCAEGIQAREVIRLAASLDQASGHVVAEALVKRAIEDGIRLTTPEAVIEMPGTGIEGRVGGASVLVGGKRFVNLRCESGERDLEQGLPEDAMTVAVALNARLAAIIVLQDEIRPEASAVLLGLKKAGVSKVVLASGDRTAIAKTVGSSLGIEAIYGDLTPEQKVEIVIKEAKASPVMMVGDGVNDTPSLAAADVGVAMGARGAAASSEVAGVVLLEDGLAPLSEAIHISQRTKTIAWQSVGVGLGLSSLAMVIAALGFLPPVAGALLQESIDVAVILNALRALR